MKLDELARNATEELVSASRGARFTSQAPAAGTRLSTGFVVAAVAMVIALAVGLPAIFLTGDDQASDFASGGTESSSSSPVNRSTAVAGFLELAGESFSVGDPVEAFSQAPMYEATLPDAPTFDMTAYGTELTLAQGQPMVADPDVIDGPAVYLGEIQGESAYLTQEIRISEDGEEYYQKCLWIGPSPQICTDFGTVAVHPAGEPIVAVWLGVPDGTVAVAAVEDGEPVGWQRPRSRVAVLPVGSGDATLIAIGSDGQEILRIDSELSSDWRHNQSEPGVTTTQPGS